MAVFLVLCVQVVVVSTWKLLTLVKNDRIFTDSSMAWVNTNVWAIAAGCVRRSLRSVRRMSKFLE
ncbi:DUF2975 domain-containing protein [Kribbella qitaiheensis]|uniref:DUF2975 domain-containing protein n=1 Tax=Kribbella qitaiheensis TaxID=1544730 RepID=UPI0031B5E0A4